MSLQLTVGRMVTFSGGVMAVIITVMVLGSVVSTFKTSVNPREQVLAVNVPGESVAELPVFGLIGSRAPWVICDWTLDRPLLSKRLFEIEGRCPQSTNASGFAGNQVDRAQHQRV